MTIFLKGLFILSVVFSNIIFFSSSYLYTVGNGFLHDKWHITFGIIIDNLEGGLLYCIDSKNNLFEIYITQRDNNKYISLIFNRVNQSLPLKQLCLCDPCNNATVGFDIKHQEEKIDIWCNSQNFESLKLFHYNYYYVSEGRIKYPVSDEFVNIGPNQIYMIMGYARQTIPDSSLTELMTGCLRYFHYNDVYLQFKEKSDNMRLSCSLKCTNDICNGGSCYEKLQRLSCDCSTTGLNGFYCNRALRTYIGGMSNSYETFSVGVSNFFFKMTWKHVSMTMPCLMEIHGGYERLMIFVLNHMLMINTFKICDVYLNRINFFTVTISREYLTIKANGKMLNIPYHAQHVLLYIGFSKSTNSCSTYTGPYDVFFDPGKVRRVIFIPESPVPVTSIQTVVPSIVQVDIVGILLIIAIVAVLWAALATIFAICQCTMNCILYRKYRKDNQVMVDVKTTDVTKQNGGSCKLIKYDTDDLSTVDYRYECIDSPRSNDVTLPPLPDDDGIDNDGEYHGYIKMQSPKK